MSKSLVYLTHTGNNKFACANLTVITCAQQGEKLPHKQTAQKYANYSLRRAVLLARIYILHLLTAIT